MLRARARARARARLVRGGATDGIRLRQATRLSSPNVPWRDKLYETHGTYVCS